MRNLILYSVIFSLFLLLGCNYDFDSIPDRTRSNYEVALPLANDTFRMIDRININFPGVIPPAQSMVFEEDYPFFLGEINWENNTLQWLTPRMVVNNNLPATIELTISCYAVTEDALIPFWINENTIITSGEFIIESKITKEKLDEVKTATRLLLQFKIITKDNTNVNDLMQSFFRVRLGAQAGITIESSL